MTAHKEEFADLEKSEEKRIHELMDEESYLFVDSLLQKMKQDCENKQFALQRLQEVLGYLINE